ncbi:uncharacterized protein LOC105214683 [Zeugodacus cucurbitae]|uniref:uncharacterized protein LOC105214683 n=1 Tax=Zeugodacus cucurbitae TaxID=28588 RepID=UPI0023D94931|nr:uncharacterized protein LOC105214683 [Zeugodacus cucurbitae]
MKYNAFIFVLLAALVLCAQAEPEPEPKPEPEPAKGQRAAFPRFRSAVDVKEARNTANVEDESDAEADVDANANENAAPNKGSNASSGRLFLKKFLLFKNMFGQQQQQPVIPIIIAGGQGTGTGSPTYGTSPSYTTVTSTGSIPTATGTISTSPTSSGRNDPLERHEEQALEDAAAAVDEQELQAALAAGAQEYVVTDQEIRGTSESKASKAPARVNLRRPGGKKGQMVTVRIPAKYRKYFKNGQKVMLNTSNRPNKRRGVQKKRINRVRRRKVGGKRRRVNN